MLVLPLCLYCEWVHVRVNLMPVHTVSPTDRRYISLCRVLEDQDLQRKTICAQDKVVVVVVCVCVFMCVCVCVCRMN